MIANRIQGMRLVHTFVLGGIATALFWIWLLGVLSVSQDGYVRWMRYILYSVVVFGAFGIEFVTSKIRNTDPLSLDLDAVLRLTFRQTLTVIGTLVFFLVAVKDSAISRVFLFSYIPALFATLLFANRLLPARLAGLLFLNKREERTLLVGEHDDAERIAAWCKRKQIYGLNVVGLACRRDVEGAASTLPVLGAASEMEDIVRKHRITNVISLSLPNSVGRFMRLADRCDRLGVRFFAINDLSKCFHRPVSFFREGGLQFVSLRDEPLECPLNRMIKRTVDICVALPVVVFVLPPLSLLVAVLHCLQSPGPLFFRQVRTGIRSRPFSIFKFRTMHVNHGTEATQAVRNDARVFKIGYWLRKLSVDEIPQFINVLKGEMSIVGPRPHMMEHDHLFARIAGSYCLRGLVKPGITGLAQVRGYRGEASTDADVLKRVESDVYYLENWSLLMEWTIIARTALQMVLPPKTAY